MGIFNYLFGKNEPNNTPIVQPQDNLVDIPKETFIDDSEPSARTNSMYSVEFASQLPIDIIYGFLREDFENKAYNDALTNPDKSYKETNLAIIRSNLEIKFDQVSLKYKDMLREIDFHIQSRGEAGLTDIVGMFASKKITYQQHLEKLEKMKEDLEKGELYMTGIFKSYEVGFTRGLASLSLHSLNLNNTI